MGITVTANPTATPPRFDVAIASTGGSAVTAVALTRTGWGVSEPTRVQPAAGPSPRVVNDVEAPWGTLVTYTAQVTSAAGVETFTGSATLDVDRPWLIHPTTPALSRPLDSGSFTAAGVVEAGPVVRAATTTAHEVLGSKYRVVTKTGPRAASRTQLTVATVTTDEAGALLAMVEDQTPLLIRVPPAWGWDWEDGYYDVGDVTTARFQQYGPERRRVFTLPIERVAAPAGTAQPQRTWADVLIQNASWASVAAGYASWTDLLTNTRR